MKVSVIEIRSGKEKIMAKRFADILVKLKRVRLKSDTQEINISASLDLFSATSEQATVTTSEVSSPPSSDSEKMSESADNSLQQDQKKKESLKKEFQKHKVTSADEAGV